MTEVAWAAGFFDGEGNISHSRTSLQVMVAQSGEALHEESRGVEVLERFRHAVGDRGVIYLRHEATERQRASYAWRVWREADVASVLALLWPHLSSPKRLQASRHRALAGMARSLWRTGRHPNNRMLRGHAAEMGRKGGSVCCQSASRSRT